MPEKGTSTSICTGHPSSGYRMTRARCIPAEDWIVISDMFECYLLAHEVSSLPDEVCDRLDLKEKQETYPSFRKMTSVHDADAVTYQRDLLESDAEDENGFQGAMQRETAIVLTYRRYDMDNERKEITAPTDGSAAIKSEDAIEWCSNKEGCDVKWVMRHFQRTTLSSVNVLFDLSDQKYLFESRYMSYLDPDEREKLCDPVETTPMRLDIQVKENGDVRTSISSEQEFNVYRRESSGLGDCSSRLVVLKTTSKIVRTRTVGVEERKGHSQGDELATISHTLSVETNDVRDVISPARSPSNSRLDSQPRVHSEDLAEMLNKGTPV